MRYQELINQFCKKNLKLISYGSVKEKKIYPLYKIVVNNNSKKTLLITSGFHGEEYNGPISLLNIVNEIIDYARKKKVNLVIYPCVNPSGFDLRKRYNASNEKPNNDFLRYEIKKGIWTSIIHPKQKFLTCKFIWSRAKEIKLLQKDLKKWGVMPVGILDIHQDNELPKCDFYSYILDKKNVYRKIMAKLDRIAARCCNVKSFMVDEEGREFNDTIDKEGFIMIHDGTITDMFYRLGSSFSAVSETNVKTPLRKVLVINKIWIKELINLISKCKQGDKKLNIKFRNLWAKKIS